MRRRARGCSGSAPLVSGTYCAEFTPSAAYDHLLFVSRALAGGGNIAGYQGISLCPGGACPNALPTATESSRGATTSAPVGAYDAIGTGVSGCSPSGVRHAPRARRATHAALRKHTEPRPDAAPRRRHFSHDLRGSLRGRLVLRRRRLESRRMSERPAIRSNIPFRSRTSRDLARSVRTGRRDQLALADNHGAQRKLGKKARCRSSSLRAAYRGAELVRSTECSFGFYDLPRSGLARASDFG